MLKEHHLFKGHPYFVTKYTYCKKRKLGSRVQINTYSKYRDQIKIGHPVQKSKNCAFQLILNGIACKVKRHAKWFRWFLRNEMVKSRWKRKIEKKAMLLDRRRSYDFRQALKKRPLNRFLRRKSPSKKRLRIDRQILVLRVKKGNYL